jgi:hypothetical protein
MAGDDPSIREQVRQLHAAGLTDVDISKRLAIGLSLVRYHRENLRLRQNRYCLACHKRLPNGRRRYCTAHAKYSSTSTDTEKWLLTRVIASELKTLRGTNERAYHRELRRMRKDFGDEAFEKLLGWAIKGDK